MVVVLRSAVDDGKVTEEEWGGGRKKRNFEGYHYPKRTSRFTYTHIPLFSYLYIYIAPVLGLTATQVCRSVYLGDDKTHNSPTKLLTTNYSSLSHRQRG